MNGASLHSRQSQGQADQLLRRVLLMPASLQWGEVLVVSGGSVILRGQQCVRCSQPPAGSHARHFRAHRRQSLWRRRGRLPRLLKRAALLGLPAHQ